MAVLASEIINRVRSQLVDEDTTQRWSDAELLRHLSDGQRTIAAIQPDVVSRVAVVQLVAGTRQTLPADGTALLNVFRNMGVDGATPGRAVRVIRRDIIDSQNPDWHTAPKATAIQNFLYDPIDSKAYFVYPPSNGTGRVEINYTYVPAEIDALTDPIELPDLYLTPLTDYVMFRAHQKDSDAANGIAMAQNYLQIFTLFVKGADAGEVETNPNLQTVPFNPETKGTAR